MAGFLEGQGLPCGFPRETNPKKKDPPEKAEPVTQIQGLQSRIFSVLQMNNNSGIENAVRRHKWRFLWDASLMSLRLSQDQALALIRQHTTFTELNEEQQASKAFHVLPGNPAFGVFWRCLKAKSFVVSLVAVVKILLRTPELKP